MSVPSLPIIGRQIRSIWVTVKMREAAMKLLETTVEGTGMFLFVNQSDLGYLVVGGSVLRAETLGRESMSCLVPYIPLIFFHRP